MVKCINIVKTARNGGYFCFIILQNIVSEARGTAWNVFSDQTQPFILSGSSYRPHTMLAGRLSSIFLG